ncbi:actin-like ATPase domain-containing protein [Dendrothele bispora CBS 962.96]|uniref:Actin-like ATPase domain-containing protein n=1 Tax=Dendrothele bispora (strain CBS 962.96) TaxID=1314807 RepID=A0A4S8MVP5_DENBC|nr:actin-like ATPase domain-containing protein [Dendrothele bispora CBS 962.96]
MSTPTTPRSKTTFNPTTPPATSRVSSSSAIHSSPHYTTTRRHSLYGVEDRVVIDPGSRIWKVGFSGEGRPRDVFHSDDEKKPLWGLSRATDAAERAEEDRLLGIKLEKALRSVFHDSLLTDPKARKVIIVENPLLPLYIKEAIARILFENLQVPSVSFASSHLLSLFVAGRITGLVLDCGHLESVALPIFAARPLFPQIRTTPLSGSRFSSHLRALLLLFGTYLPPTSPGPSGSLPAASRSVRVPPEILTDTVMEEVKTRCCFVGESLSTVADSREATPFDDQSTDMDFPPSSDATPSESDYSYAGHDSAMSSVQSSVQDSSEFSVISHPRAPDDRRGGGGENQLQALATMYKRHSTATDLKLPVTPPLTSTAGLGNGTLIIPGWVRERTAEVLFEGGDVDESSVAEVILDALLKVPVDLRKTLASSILVIGGTSMLPGFIPRLYSELIRALQPPPFPARPPVRPDRPPPPQYDRYAALRPLIPYFAVLNNPSPEIPMSDRAKANSGKAPAFSPATMAWVGGSLAGALKTGGVEVSREKWDEVDAEEDADTSMDVVSPDDKRPTNILPDWTRMPLPTGAEDRDGEDITVEVSLTATEVTENAVDDAIEKVGDGGMSGETGLIAGSSGTPCSSDTVVALETDNRRARGVPARLSVNPELSDLLSPSNVAVSLSSSSLGGNR